MIELSKNRKIRIKKVQAGKAYVLRDALDLAKKCALAKFVESVDVNINLGIDTRKSDQVVRGAVVLPHGVFRSVRVAVFTSGDNVEKARQAGADIVGMDDLMQSMQNGDLNYDVVIASPDAMGVVGRLGRLLGPRGLMPNPKVGTVTIDVASAVKKAKSGQVRYRADKGGVIHASIGNVKMDSNMLAENINALLEDLKKVKPSGVKGVYFKKISLSTTMGVGINVDLATTNISSR